ncbi:MAG TPA: hypothetical protein VK487_06275 [Candidatus Bathyarchaeia archaeon]|nr:hypothetical protein [Candidatus Bathyarchaeia archaeon]
MSEYESKSHIVRVSNDILSALRKAIPELHEASDAELVKNALRKFILYHQYLGKLSVEEYNRVLHIFTE